MSGETPKETTFRSFTHQQGTNYAQFRHNYHSRLYEIVIDYHTSTGGQLNTVVDVGCGPGIAVRTVAPLFTHAIGLDPSEGMISTAQSLDGVLSNSGSTIRFDISTAEEMGSNLTPPIEDGSVDLIIAATAAHWFDMSVFWSRAAQVLKPGGSVALWTSGSISVDPSMPCRDALQTAIDSHEQLLEEYMTEGNRLARHLYVNLLLPWEVATPVTAFDKGTMLRREWGTGSESEPGDQFLAEQQGPVTLDMLEMVWGTASPVVRWREAHPDAIGTERDVVKVVRNRIERVFHDAGVEVGKEVLKGGVSGVLLMLKKNA